MANKINLFKSSIFISSEPKIRIMKQRFSQKAVFIAKSLVWSVMIYTGCMLMMNWDEVTLALRSRQPVSSVAHVITQPPVIPAIVSANEPSSRPSITTGLPVLVAVKNVLVLLVHITSGK
jgi:hypothetical protein